MIQTFNIILEWFKYEPTYHIYFWLVNFINSHNYGNCK